MTPDPKPLRCLIFDMDGTLVDVPYDWRKIKHELGTGGLPVLAYLDGLTEPERGRKWKTLEELEERATLRAALKPGVHALLAKLAKHRVTSALVTNNSRRNVDTMLERFRLDFDLVLSRESGLWKPSPAAFLEVMRNFRLSREECAVVGDSRFDWEAARGAGIDAIFLIGAEPLPFDPSPGEWVKDFGELEYRISPRLVSV